MATHSGLHRQTLTVSPLADQLLRQIAVRMGVSKASALERVIREKANTEGIAISSVARPKTIIPSGGARSAAEVYAIAADIAALGETATLAPGADSREAIYGDRA